MIKYLWVVDEMAYIEHMEWGKETFSSLFESGAASSVGNLEANYWKPPYIIC